MTGTPFLSQGDTALPYTPLHGPILSTAAAPGTHEAAVS
jgi:hypothetical protein